MNTHKVTKVKLKISLFLYFELRVIYKQDIHI